MGISPLPTITATMSAEYQQELDILHKLQAHALTNSQITILAYILDNPFLPLSWKLAIYNYLSSLQLQISPVGVTISVICFPIFVLIFMYLLVRFILFLIKTLVPYILSKFGKEENNKTFLELTFPSDTSKTAYATEELYKLIHTLARRKSLRESLTGVKKQYSLEVVSTKALGIRFLLVTPSKNSDILKRSLLSYLPGIKIKEVDDYLSNDTKEINQSIGIAELKLSSHFALPLNKQKALDEHDPIAYITGHMTGLSKDDLVAFQVITTPVLSSTHANTVLEANVIRRKMYRQEALTPILQKGIVAKLSSVPGLNILIFILKALAKISSVLFIFIIHLPMAVMDSSGNSLPFMETKIKVIPSEILNPYEQELKTIVKEKIDKHLFETTIRILVKGKDTEEMNMRMSGILSSFGLLSSPFQTITTKGAIGLNIVKTRFNDFKDRKLSRSTVFNENPILSISELSDIYHFPYLVTTKTEDLAKSLSPDFPAPLELKNNDDLDCVFGKNYYGNQETEIGLTDDQRARHVYILGKTGSGKSTVIFNMAKEDIQKDRGVAVIDPHGDLAEDLLSVVPMERLNDLVYFNPFDLKFPIGINLLELDETLEGDELELEKELVAEGVISVFRRIFSKEEYVNAHRIEYILRNTIYTSFAVSDRTLFTLYKLLNDKKYRTGIVNSLEDEDLKSFWRNEFGKAGSYQAVKMAAGVTAKIGRFLFSPTAKRIIEQEKSTINFEKILNNKKILICNLSEGKIGEDTAQVLGLTILAKIHQAALKRARNEQTDRVPFYLYVDEFQNFATTSFTRILSGGRKFGLRLTLAEQSTAQQQDRSVVDVILANIGTVICFATSSPIDEQMMEPQFFPLITRENLTNLPKYKFYIKLTATNPEEPFSGETIKPVIKKDKQLISQLIEASRINNAREYKNNKNKSKIVKKDNKTKEIGKIAKHKK